MKSVLLSSLATILFGAGLSSVSAQSAFPLWPDGAPGALGASPDDIPTLTVYLPEEPTGAAMVICPGGGYGGLAKHEGEGYAQWLAAHGVTGFVLKYRLGSHGYRHPAMLNDAARAVRYVRANAARLKVDPQRIGIMGSSAGGHLAATLLTHFTAGDPNAADPVERVSSRPDLGVLCYAVITMGVKTHGGSRDNLLGKNPSSQLIEELSNEKHVSKDTPPCFLWSTWEDATVDVENTMAFAEALREQHVPFDLHIYQKGGHGMGLGQNAYDPAQLHPWTNDCLYWLRIYGFVK